MQIVLPQGALGDPTDVWSEELRRLTRLANCDDKAYGLGGEDGYGLNYENETFRMHRYCWCDLDECPYCSGDSDMVGDAGTQASALFWHKPSGIRIWWYKWIGRGMAIDGDDGTRLPSDIVDECLASMKK